MQVGSTGTLMTPLGANSPRPPFRLAIQHIQRIYADAPMTIGLVLSTLSVPIALAALLRCDTLRDPNAFSPWPRTAQSLRPGRHSRPPIKEMDSKSFGEMSSGKLTLNPTIHALLWIVCVCVSATAKVPVHITKMCSYMYI